MRPPEELIVAATFWCSCAVLCFRRRMFVQGSLFFGGVIVYVAWILFGGSQ